MMATPPGAWLAAATMALLVAAQCLLPVAEAAGAPCGKTALAVAAASLLPCKGAASYPNAKVSKDCCNKVRQLSPSCLCAVLTSPLARQAKINPAYAISIPKRCNFGRRARHAGYKCGRLTIP